jgi:hypothetical protein
MGSDAPTPAAIAPRFFPEGDPRRNVLADAILHAVGLYSTAEIDLLRKWLSEFHESHKIAVRCLESALEDAAHWKRKASEPAVPVGAGAGVPNGQ